MSAQGGRAAVAIGRNEGRRLERCIESLRGQFAMPVKAVKAVLDFRGCCVYEHWCNPCFP